MFETSTTISELAKALAQFQSEVKSVKKDGVNPFFHSAYATLENVIATVKDPLAKNGLSYSQFPTGDNELCTILMHTSGEFLKATMKICPKDSTPQAQGSAITYARRYALSAVLGLATETDDDGNAATKTIEYDAPKKKFPFAKKQEVDVFGVVKGMLKTLKHDPRTLGEAKELVKKLTELELTKENVPEIESRLSVLLEETDPLS